MALSSFAFALTALISVATADLSPIIATYSPACQLVINYNASQYIDTSIACSKDSILTGYESLVRIGFCNEEEYSNLTNTVCNTAYPHLPSSLARLNFTAALNNVSSNCQQGAYRCIKSTVIAVVSKQQEQYCSPMSLNINNITSENCLTTGVNNCTQGEFQQLKTAACLENTTWTNQTFSTALLSTTPTCQSQISQCADNSSGAWRYVLSETYCYAMYIGGDKPTEACFKENNACTASEFSDLKFAACGPDTTTAILNTTASSIANGTITTTNHATKPSNDAWKLSGDIIIFISSCILFFI